ncbi:hypothetical protein IGK47_000958 [Enterococcus sp. AZ007]
MTKLLICIDIIGFSVENAGLNDTGVIVDPQRNLGVENEIVWENGN